MEGLGKMIFNNVYAGKTVLVTGHAGFKGSWLAQWLHVLGAKVGGYALTPNTQPALFDILHLADKIDHTTGSILNTALLEKTITSFQPEIIFHLAAQQLVRLSYQQPVETYQTNVMGTLHVLEAARKCCSVKAFVNVTTDKCYENKETGRNFEEEDPFGGYDPYSSSKGCVEILSASYRRSFLQNGGYALATARAGNVIGGGDWALDRIVPDCIRAIVTGKDIEIRNPAAVRPWQHVLEPLSGYLLLGYKLYTCGSQYAEGFNFGPREDSVLTVAEIANQIVSLFGKGKVVINKQDNLHEAGLLMLSIKKAEKVLHWQPVLSAKQAIADTVTWYRTFYNRGDVNTLTIQQIQNYMDKITYDN